MGEWKISGNIRDQASMTLDLTSTQTGTGDVRVCAHMCITRNMNLGSYLSLDLGAGSVAHSIK